MASTEQNIAEYAERIGVDLRKAHRECVTQLVWQAVEVAYNLYLLPGSDSPFAKRLRAKYDVLVEKIGYDPIPL